MKKIGVMPFLIFILCSVALLWAHVEINEIPHNLQYILPPPQLDLTGGGDDYTAEGEQTHGSEKNQQGQYKALLKSLKDTSQEWAQAITGWTLGAQSEKSAVSTALGNSMDVRISFRGENAQAIDPVYLRYGRNFFPQELTGGDRVMLIDDRVALGLFSEGDATGRTVEWQGERWRVIGVVRHSRMVGEYEAAAVYLPLLALDDIPFQPDVIMVEAVPQSSGALSTFQSGMEQWQKGGTLINLEKETMVAGIWLRVLIFLTALLGGVKVIRLMSAAFMQFVAKCRKKMRSQYFTRLLPWFLSTIMLFICGFVAITGVLIIAFRGMIQPIYVFPQWIPKVLVEPKDIAQAFWNVWKEQAHVMEYRSPQVLRLRFLTWVVQWATLGAGAVLAFLLGRWKMTWETAAENLRNLADEGAMITTVVAEDDGRLPDLGYAHLENGRYVRILRVKDLLATMPPMGQDGSFIVQITDPVLDENNATYAVCTQDGVLKVRRTRRAYEIQLPIDTLTEILCGCDDLPSYVERHTHLNLRKRSRAMDEFFSNHIRV